MKQILNEEKSLIVSRQSIYINALLYTAPKYKKKNEHNEESKYAIPIDSFIQWPKLSYSYEHKYMNPLAPHNFCFSVCTVQSPRLLLGNLLILFQS